MLPKWLLGVVVVPPAILVTVAVLIVAVMPARKECVQTYRLAVLQELTCMLQALMSQDGQSRRRHRSPMR